MSFSAALPSIAQAIARSIAPRRSITVSEWADAERRLSSKGSSEPGRWRTDRNPPLREPMDALSARIDTRDVVCMFPIQFGKSEIAANALGYTMTENPGPIMVCLPGEVSMSKWIAQKLGPMIEEVKAVRDCLTTTNSRNGANRRDFKDFFGGQLYLEHAGSPGRLKSTSVKTLIADELDEFAANFVGGDDPVAMLDGRTTAFPGTSKRLYISTPQTAGLSRIEALFMKSDQRRYHVPCPHCNEFQPLEWSGLIWGGESVEYACRECGEMISERYKTRMIAAGRWVAGNPESKIRGYTINCLYYQIGLGPRWPELVEKWLDAQDDPAKLKTFINDRLAEPWIDPSMRAVKQNTIRDRSEQFRLRTAPAGVLAITAGVDTQDNRLAVQIVGWGRSMASWVLDYIELHGDPSNPEVWSALTALLNTPIETASGGEMRVDATCIDAGGHRTECVYDYVRSSKIRRPMAIFGAVPSNAPALSKGRMMDTTRRGKSDRRGIFVHHVGTVVIKHALFARLSTDADKPADARLCHFSDELPQEYFAGLVSETYDPRANRFVKKRGARNEALDTYVYAYAATNHQELRLHRFTKTDWDRMEARQRVAAPCAPPPATLPPPRKVAPRIPHKPLMIGW